MYILQASVPGTAESEELLEYLDKIETDLKDAEERSTKTSATRKSTASRYTHYSNAPSFVTRRLIG